MSAYGRIWQQIADIREKLAKPLPVLTTNTLNEAVTAHRAQMKQRDELLDQWAKLEAQAAALPDE